MENLTQGREERHKGRFGQNEEYRSISLTLIIHLSHIKAAQMHSLVCHYSIDSSALIIYKKKNK